MADPTYFVSALASVAGASKRHLTVFNPLLSGKTMRVLRVQAAGAPVAAVTGLVIALTAVRIIAAPVGGTAVVIGKADTADPVPPTGFAAVTGATAATEETGSPAFGIGTVTGEETGAPTTAVLYDFAICGARAILCREGQGFVVKQGALASAGAINVLALFSLIPVV